MRTDARFLADHRIGTEIQLRQRDRRRAGFIVGQLEHVAAVGGKRKLEQRAPEAGTLVDDGEHGARGDIEPGKGAAQVSDHLAHEPVVLVGFEDCVGRQHFVHVSTRVEDPRTDLQVIRAQRQDGVVELARHGERPPRVARCVDRLDAGRNLGPRREDRDRRGALLAIDHRIHVIVVVAAGVDRALERIEGHAFTAPARALRAERCNPFSHCVLERLRFRDVIHQLPLLCAVGAHAFARRAEHVGEIAPDFSLVGDAREAARSGEDAQQRQLGQARRRGAIVDHQDLIAGERELVAAARDRAVDRGEGLQALVAARVLDAAACFVGEFAEIHLPCVRGLAKHVDVGA